MKTTLYLSFATFVALMFLSPIIIDTWNTDLAPIACGAGLLTSFGLMLWSGSKVVKSRKKNNQ